MTLVASNLADLVEVVPVCNLAVAGLVRREAVPVVLGRTELLVAPVNWSVVGLLRTPVSLDGNHRNDEKHGHRHVHSWSVSPARPVWSHSTEHIMHVGPHFFCLPHSGVVRIATSWRVVTWRGCS